MISERAIATTRIQSRCLPFAALRPGKPLPASRTWPHRNRGPRPVVARCGLSRASRTASQRYLSALAGTRRCAHGPAPPRRSLAGPSARSLVLLLPAGAASSQRVKYTLFGRRSAPHRVPVFRLRRASTRTIAVARRCEADTAQRSTPWRPSRLATRACLTRTGGISRCASGRATRLTSQHLYRATLKSVTDWCRRPQSRIESIKVRAVFESHAQARTPREMAEHLHDLEALELSWRHPNPYIPPSAPGGTKFERFGPVRRAALGLR